MRRCGGRARRCRTMRAVDRPHDVFSRWGKRYGRCADVRHHVVNRTRPANHQHNFFLSLPPAAPAGFRFPLCHITITISRTGVQCKCGLLCTGRLLNAERAISLDGSHALAFGWRFHIGQQEGHRGVSAINRNTVVKTYSQDTY